MSLALSPGLARLRQRTIWTLVAGVALGSTGHIAAVTVATIVARDMLGPATLAGRARAPVVVGAGHRLGRPLGPHGPPRSPGRARRSATRSASAGAFVATASVLTGSFAAAPPRHAADRVRQHSNQLSRYTAADLVPPARRASAIGTVVWGATIGVGRRPVARARLERPRRGRRAARRSPARILVPVVFVGAAAVLSFVLLRPDPYEIADTSAPRARETAPVGGTVALARRSSGPASSRRSRRSSSASS